MTIELYNELETINNNLLSVTNIINEYNHTDLV